MTIPPSALHVEQIDAPLVLEFLSNLQRNRGNAAPTRNVRLAAIKSFFRFIEYRVPSALEQIRRILAIPPKKTEERLVSHLTALEMKAVVAAPDPATRDGIRDRAMIHMAFSAGLRVSELVGLRLNEVSLDGTPSILVRGKGRRERALPLTQEGAQALRAWMAVRGHASVPELFLNARGNHLTRAGFPVSSVGQYMEAALWPQVRRPDAHGVISHESALTLYGLSDASPNKIHLTLPTQFRIRRTAPKHLVIHYADIEARDEQQVHGVPVTTPARAIRDAHASHLGPALIRQAIADGQRTGHLTLDEAERLERELLGTKPRRQSSLHDRRVYIEEGSKRFLASRKISA